MTGLAVRAQVDPPPVTPPLTRILFVFDGSQSMYGRWESGQKIDIAQKMMSNMLDSLAELKSENFQLALRVYGHQKPVPPQDCNDTRLEVPFGPDNIPRIKRVLRSITPKGTTPIARSLQRAATDFPQCANCRNIIILITDGIESCDEDPCAASRLLQKQGIILKPFVIGIGLDPEAQELFNCVGNYYNAADEKTFEKVLGVVISQALDNTTAQVNLLDVAGRSTETDVPMTFYNHASGGVLHDFVHTLNYKGNPDTLVLDPLMTYDLVVHTIPPVRLDSIRLTPGSHHQIGVNTPRGTLDLRWSSRGTGEAPGCLVKRSGSNEILNVQNFGTTQKYLQGTYDLEILSLPRVIQRGLKIDGNKTTFISLPPPGRVSMNASTPGHGALFVARGNTWEWVLDLDPALNRHSYWLLPGDYKVVFRPANSKSTLYTVTQRFSVSSGGSEIIKLR